MPHAPPLAFLSVRFALALAVLLVLRLLVLRLRGPQQRVSLLLVPQQVVPQRAVPRQEVDHQVNQREVDLEEENQREYQKRWKKVGEGEDVMGSAWQCWFFPAAPSQPGGEIGETPTPREKAPARRRGRQDPIANNSATAAPMIAHMPSASRKIMRSLAARGSGEFIGGPAATPPSARIAA